MVKAYSVVLAIVMVLLPTLSFATSHTRDLVTNPPVKTGEGFLNLITSVVSWVQRIFFIIAALFVIVAAFSFLTAQGDSEKVANARNALTYAAIAIVVAIIAFGVTKIVTNIVGP